MNINLQGLLSALEKPKSNPVGKVSFHSDKVNENEIISEHEKRWNSLVNHLKPLSQTFFGNFKALLWNDKSNKRKSY